MKHRRTWPISVPRSLRCESRITLQQPTARGVLKNPSLAAFWGAPPAAEAERNRMNQDQNPKKVLPMCPV